MEDNLKNTKSLFNYFIPLILVVQKYFKWKRKIYTSIKLVFLKQNLVPVYGLDHVILMLGFDWLGKHRYILLKSMRNTLFLRPCHIFTFFFVNSFSNLFIWLKHVIYQSKHIWILMWNKQLFAPMAEWKQNNCEFLNQENIKIYDNDIFFKNQKPEKQNI